MAEEHKSSTFVVLFWIGIVIIAAMGGVMGIFWKSLPPQLPWFYSLPWGDQQLISKLWLVWVLLGMGVVLFLTRMIAKWAGKNDPTVQTTIMIAGVTAVLIVAASFVRIMSIFLVI